MKAIKSIKVDAEIHEAAKVQAEAKGMTLRGYIKMLVSDDKPVSPEYADVLKRVAAGSIMSKMDAGMSRVAAEAETEVLIKGLM